MRLLSVKIRRLSLGERRNLFRRAVGGHPRLPTSRRRGGPTRVRGENTAREYAQPRCGCSAALKQVKVGHVLIKLYDSWIPGTIIFAPLLAPLLSPLLALLLGRPPTLQQGNLHLDRKQFDVF